jgi:tetraacyldisaccharide-1-P 4'-kinase
MSRLRDDAASEGRTIVATEKDAVKMARLDTTPDTVRILRSRIEWDWGRSELEALLDRVAAGRDS